MAENTTETTLSFLEKILDNVHPLMAEALYVAAVPNWYNTELVAAIRLRDDGREEGLITRLARYSFIVPLTETDTTDLVNYTVRPDERAFLQRHWIAKDAQAYLQAQQRALAFWTTNPDPNRFAHAENLLYHQLFVDIRAGMDYLVDRFRAYYGERQLAAIERLLETAAAARFFLAMLENDSLGQLDDLLLHLQARLNQLRGQWDDSLEALMNLRQKPALAPWLTPYVARAYGNALAHTGHYVEAVEQYAAALELFNQSATTLANSASIQSERAYSMIAMGDAYVALATSVRGYRERVRPDDSPWRRMRDFFYFFLSLPLVCYLSLHLGRRVWHPRFWHLLNGLDWIVARLFASGAQLYNRADPILEKHGTPVEGVAADEQLARLYLSMGDMDKAQEIFSRLLAEEEAPLGEYRRASIRLGLGQALIGVGHCRSAREQLQLALPVLALYEDRAAQAETEKYLGEALLADNEPSEALARLSLALTYYLDNQLESRATDLAEQLEQWAKHDSLAENQRQLARDMAEQVIQRRYPVRYRHPATVFFQRAMLGLLAIALVLIPASSIRLETGVAIAPEITFQASPLLQHDNPDFTPDLNQSVMALDLAATADPDILLWLAALLFLAYLFLATSIGMLVISRTSLAKVQRAAAAETVYLDDQQLRLGPENALQAIKLADATRFHQANMFFVQHLMVDDSAATLRSSQRRLVLSGRTAWYPSLCQRLAQRLPKSVPQINLSFSMIRSRLGIWYLATIGAILFLALLGQYAANLVIRDAPLLFYSLADLYPFLYFGLLVPPFCWFVIWPLRMRLRNDPTSPLPWWIGGAGLLLMGLRILTGFQPWLTIPDIYVPLLILLLTISGAVTIWRARLPKASEPLYSARLRLAVALATVAVGAVATMDLARELGAYHYLVQGHAWRDESLRREAEAPANAAARQAVASYDRAIRISGFPLLGIVRSDAPRNLPASIPQPQDFVRNAALQNRAAMFSQLSQYEAAIDDYSRLLNVLNEPAEVYADRAMAYLRLAATKSSNPESSPEVVQIYALALADFDQAIAANLANARYRLWRGVAYHALGRESEALGNYQTALGISGQGELRAQDQAKAQTGLGWIAYARGEYETAVSTFQAAITADPGSAEAHLGLGYAYYSLRQYDDALRIWSEAAELNPSDPAIFISLGTLYWRVGTLGEDYDAAGTDRCRSSALSEVEKRRSAAQLEQAIENLSLSTTIPGQQAEAVAFTFRTMAQVQFLLRYCPGYDDVEVLRQAIEYYSEAIQLDPENAVYWQMRGRLSYSLWFNSPAGSGPAAREILFAGLNDLEQALAIDPAENNSADYRPNHYRRILFNEAVDGTLAQGDQRLASGEFPLALAYYRLVAQNQPGTALPAFKAGLAALAAGDQDEALTWYLAGFDRASANADTSAVQIAWLEYRALISRRNLADTAIGELFDNYGPQLDQPEDAATAFNLALIAVSSEALSDQAADLYERAVALASSAANIDLVKSAAAALRDFALANPQLDETELYWPLDQEREAHESSVAALPRPDLYWRYRAEFGFRFVIDLFKQRVGREAIYESIFAVVMADIEEAFRLNDSDSFRTWRDFFVDANIGWLYLRRGDEFFAAENYESALKDYASASERIQPESSNAANDLADATFRAGLTSFILGELDQANTWYDQGFALTTRHAIGQAILDKAIADLVALIQREDELAAEVAPILQELSQSR